MWDTFRIDSCHCPENREGPWAERLIRCECLSGFFAGRRVCELGCGTGRGSLAIAAAALSVVGLDSSLLAIERARRQHAAANLRFYPASNGAIDVAGDLFDVVLVSESWSWNNPSLLIEDLNKVLAAGGLALIVCKRDLDHGSKELRSQALTDLLAKAFNHCRVAREDLAFGFFLRDQQGTQDRRFERSHERASWRLPMDFLGEARSWIILASDADIAPLSHCVSRIAVMRTQDPDPLRFAELEAALQQGQWSLDEAKRLAQGQNQRHQAELDHLERSLGFLRADISRLLARQKRLEDRVDDLNSHLARMEKLQPPAAY